MLLNEGELRRRIYKVYSAMKKEAGNKYFKTGRRKGQLRILGIELPFDKFDLWDHALNQVGEGRIACPYCVESGRDFVMISLEDCVFDHHVPKSRGGTWELSNLQCCCRRCNTEKGEFSYEFFLYITEKLNEWDDMQDRRTAYKLLRGQGYQHQHHRDYKPKSAALPDFIADANQLEF